MGRLIPLPKANLAEARGAGPRRQQDNPIRCSNMVIAGVSGGRVQAMLFDVASYRCRLPLDLEFNLVLSRESRGFPGIWIRVFLPGLKLPKLRRAACDGRRGP